MALIVQQQPPVEGANSYASVQAFRDYHSVRGTDTTEHPDPTVEAALVQASQFIDVRFGDQFVGYTVDPDQDLLWPRSAAFDRRGDRLDGVPKALVWATAEYALRALSAPLLADPTRDATGQAVKSKEEEVGPIKEKVEYVEHGPFQMPIYPLADAILKTRGLIVSASGGGIRVGDVGRA